MDTLTAEKLAETLQEPKKSLLAKVLRTLGQERCQTIFADTLTIERTGGMLVQAGDRRRTPGGTFIQLVHERTTGKERQRIFPNAPAQAPSIPQAPSWDEVQTITHPRHRGPRRGEEDENDARRTPRQGRHTADLCGVPDARSTTRPLTERTPTGAAHPTADLDSHGGAASVEPRQGEPQRQRG